jgi:hypothetical protein
MARSANSANIRRDEQGPDFKAVVDLVRGRLRTNDADQKSLAQDNATMFTRIEKQHGVHKGAAKTFAQVDKMAAEKRTDFLRSLLGLLGIAGYDNFDDLVDRAQKPAGKPAKETPKPAGKGSKAQVPDALEGDNAPGLERTNLKTGMLERHIGGGADDDDSNWEDVREATPDELAAERTRLADFEDEEPQTGNVHPFPAAKP